MAIYFSLAALIFIFGIGYNTNLSERRQRNFIFVAFGLLILVAALRSADVGIDLAGHYAKRYEMIASYSWDKVPAFSALTTYEIGYCYYTKLLTCISTDVQFYIAVSALIMYSITGYFIYKKSSDVVMSTELFICMCVYYMYMNIMRQGLAVSIVLLGYLYLDRNRRSLKGYIGFALMILLASTFHDSAILCLLMILFDRMRFTRKQIFVAGIATVAMYFIYSRVYIFILSLFRQGNNYERYLTSSTEGVGNLNRQSLTLFVLTAGAFFLAFYVFVWRRRNKVESMEDLMIEKDESFMLYMGLIATVCRLLLFRMNIINRFSYYFIPFILILYPNAITACELRGNRRILRMFVYLAFAVYFVWMTISYAEQFYGTVPYQFYWN